MAGVPWLIDTNVLLSWVHPQTPKHSTAIEAIRKIARQSDICCYAPQNLVEFWRVCTRPVQQNGFGLSTREADSKARLIEDHFRLLPDISLIHDEWRRLAVQYSVSGVQVHDARLAAAMYVHGVAHILTFNSRDFARFPGIHAVDPAQV
jgi:predicted nucleic acid-binding protein